MRQRLVCRAQGKGDEAVHAAQLLGGDDGLGIPAGLRVFVQAGNPPGNGHPRAFSHLVGEGAHARLACQQPLPCHLHIAPQRGDQAQACDDHPSIHIAPFVCSGQSLFCSIDDDRHHTEF
ncbi:hypothetical protein D3C72_1680120 [compost metagenome]